MLDETGSWQYPAYGVGQWPRQAASIPQHTTCSRQAATSTATDTVANHTPPTLPMPPSPGSQQWLGEGDTGDGWLSGLRASLWGLEY